MRRLTLILSAALLVLAVAPAAALAQHHRRHHSRIERFGDVRVKSFSGGVLTIMLRNGSTVRGRVNKNIRLECMAPQVTRDGRDGGSGDDQAQSSGDGSAGEGLGDVAEQNENQVEEQNENQAEEQNENQAEEQNENQAEHCSTMNLTPGRVAREAELRVFSGGKKVWEKVEPLS